MNRRILLPGTAGAGFRYTAVTEGAERIKKEWSAANVHHGTGGVEHSFVVYKKSECCIQKKSESSWTISSEYDIISNGILDWMTA